MKIKINNMSVRVQLVASIIVLFILSSCIVAFFTYRATSQILLTRSIREQQRQIELVADAVQREFNNVKESATDYANLLAVKLAPADPTVYAKPLAGHTLADYKTGDGSRISDAQATLTWFKEQLNVDVTVFLLDSQQNFVRVATTLSADESQGSTAIGTAMPRSAPAFAPLQNRQTQASKVNLFGTDYYAIYKPLLAQDGQVVGAIFIGLPITQIENDLIREIKTLKWGETGYSMIIDASEQGNGTVIYHPESDLIGHSILSRNGDGRDFSALLSQDSGVMIYPHVDETGHVDDKYLAFASVPEWQWKITAGTYIHEITQETQQILLKIILISLLSCLLVTLITSVLIKRIMASLPSSLQLVERISTGDLSARLPVHPADSRNELMKLMASMGTLTSSLTGIISAIKDSATTVGSTSNELENYAKAGLQHSNQQQEQIEQVATAIEEMASSAQSIAEQVESIAQSVNDANGSSKTTMTLVDAMLGQMDQLDKQLDDSARSMHDIEHKSESIHLVTDMINSIADQTNLLALNAAIEAARAGEHGRGFSVVADEVRKLAHQTQESVRQVMDIVTELQSSIKTSVTQVSTSKTMSNSVSASAQQANAALNGIAENIDKVAMMADAIATTSEEQAQVAQEISMRAQDMKDSSQVTLHSAQETLGGSQRLDQESKELLGQIQFFSIRDPRLAEVG